MSTIPRPPGERRVVSSLLTIAACLTVVAALLARFDGQEIVSWDLATVGCLGTAMLVGELMRLGGRDDRGIAPVATASTLALALAYNVGGHPLSYGAPVVVVLAVATVMFGATALMLQLGMRLGAAGYAVRIIVVAAVAVSFRELPLASGRSLAEAAAAGTFERWQIALVMLALIVLAQALELTLHVWRRATSSARTWRAILREDVREKLPIAFAAMSTGVVVALGLRAAGLIAIPLFLSPLVLMRFAIQRQQSARRARQQAIAALSRLTDLAGYTRDGHAERVAKLCAQVGRLLHMSERDLVELDSAALLHDIGQVALRSPVHGGATVGLAPIDQQKIADDGADIVERTGALDTAAQIIREHPAQFRFLREEGRPLSQAARILKACNAFDDLTAGDPTRRDAALERIMLGLGYEYDPEAVDALRLATSMPALRPG